MGDAPARKELSEEPVSILFNPSAITRRNVWDVDIVAILDLLVAILEKSGRTDLRVAGMAALTSSLIYRLKVESIFALHREAERVEPKRRRDVNIDVLGIPYRHESTSPVSLDDLLGLLESLIVTIANPRERRRSPLLEPAPPAFEDYFVSIESVIGKYEDLIVRKASAEGTALLGDIVAGLELIDRIRCFFAALFLARDERAELEQEGDDIRVTLVGGAPGREAAGPGEAAGAGGA